MIEENAGLEVGIRARRRNRDKDAEKEKARQPNQIKLRKEKIEEIKNRYIKNTLIKSKVNESVDVSTLIS